MDSRLDGPRAKVERAKEHIQDLEAAVGAFLGGSPYSGVTYVDAKTGEWVCRSKVLAHPPVRLALIAGDAIHNLRSALDLLAWQLVEANGGVPSDRTGYPFCKSAQELESTLKRKVQGVSELALDLIRMTKPYDGGNIELWQVHRLDIADKHRLLVTVGAAYSRVGLIGESTYGSVGPRSFPLVDGAEVYRVPGSHEDNYMGFTFEIALADGEVVQGEPLVPTLLQLAQVVERTVESFTPVL